MTFQGNIDRLVGREVVGSDGERIGDVGQVFVLEGTDEPTWITVRTGLFGMHESFIPVAGATERGDGLVVPFEKSFVKDAPRIDDASELEPCSEIRYQAVLNRIHQDNVADSLNLAVGHHPSGSEDDISGGDVGRHTKRLVPFRSR